MAYSSDDERHPMAVPVLVSLMGHLLLLGIILYTPKHDAKVDFNPSVIDVRMVEMPAAKSESVAPAAIEAGKTEPDKKAEVSTKADSAVQRKAEVSLAKPAPRKKTALKYETLKSKRVLKKALERIEQRVQTEPPKPLADTIKRLRDKVEEQGRPENTARIGGEAPGNGTGSKREGEVIELYRLDVAYVVNKNWAFSEQLAGGGENLLSALTFKVMPDGRIEDISFTDRSGNAVLDESALRAIMKSSPVRPHPPEIKQPYVIMGLRFGPRGIQ
ncbi:MAG: TonB family protein [Desulfatitalea sp.]|nr:TonB family protein [Desulfatitalea sp.]